MNLITTIFFFTILGTHLLFAQIPNDNNRDNLWLFGYDSYTLPHLGGVAMDFNPNMPEVYLQPRPMDLSQTNASICDQEGNLLFYTNGIYIANAQHETMVNGDSINPGIWTSSYPSGLPISQGALILPLPESNTKYMLIHGLLDVLPGLGPIYSNIYYSVVDMSLDNGLGAVTEKNIEVLAGEFHSGKVTAVRHGNGRDWWVLIPEHDSNRYHRLLLTPNGFELVQSQDIGEAVTSGIGQSTFSPDGSKYVRYDGVSISNGNYMNFYDFNRCSGLLGNQIQLTVVDSSWGVGVAISPNSRFAYFSSFRYIYQYDLWAQDIPSSLDTVAIYDGHVSPWPFSSTFYLSQLAPDGKIYVNTRDAGDIIHVIHNPDKKGEACNVEQHAIQLPTLNSFSIPNYPFFNLGPLDGSTCDFLGIDNTPRAKYRYEQDTMDYLQVQFTDLSYYEPAEWFWDFGDNATSGDTSPVHTFMQDGTYEVCLTVSNQYGENTFCRTLQLGTVSAGEEVPAVGINVFPNPCREGVNVIISDYLPRDAKVVLYDAIGQHHKVQSLQTGWNNLRLDGLNAGLYFYEIWEGQVLLESGKLVKVE